MKTGFTIYVSNLTELIDFYQQVFHLELTEKETDFALLEADNFELALLETETSRNLNFSNSPRETSPIKPTFFVNESLQPVAQRIEAAGGGMRDPKEWTFHGRIVCDAWDCEGNIFQLRLVN